ncbi:ATP-grasp domain-containing protein [bacterium]|nr:ATP-grasp domain-containing protein [Acidimicrobiaceae bacterium]MDB4205802.1 ATP-grasp domain-containing protein [bacterium]MDC1301870.1 ATP-grasp domain-containing protein [bacterium]MDC1389582.1 ATP-grasp domain-containing protein [Acidimicrobiales bacterium]HAY66699.1 biotin carboxylase [Acidimicrobiaceae bacterium]
MSSHLHNPRVLVTGAGGPAGVSVIRSLNAEAYVFAIDIDPCAVGLYLVGSGRRALVPRGEDFDFVDRIIDLCRRWQIDVVVPTVDTELLPFADGRERFKELGVEVIVASKPALLTCLDKWLLACTVELTVRCPVTYLIDVEFDPLEFPSWPAIAKPRQGSGSRGVQLLDGPEDLSRVPRDGSFILQEYLPGEELSVDVYVDCSGEPIGAVPRTRLKVDSGVSVAGRTVRDDEAIQLALDTVTTVGLTGPANVQCRRDRDGHLALLEVNPRFPGSLPLTIAAGFDIPKLALSESLGYSVDRLVSFDEIGIVRHWEDVIIHADAIAEMSAAVEGRVA